MWSDFRTTIAYRGADIGEPLLRAQSIADSHNLRSSIRETKREINRAAPMIEIMLHDPIPPQQQQQQQQQQVQTAQAVYELWQVGVFAGSGLVGLSVFIRNFIGGWKDWKDINKSVSFKAQLGGSTLAIRSDEELQTLIDLLTKIESQKEDWQRQLQARHLEESRMRELVAALPNATPTPMSEQTR